MKIVKILSYGADIPDLNFRFDKEIQDEVVDHIKFLIKNRSETIKEIKKLNRQLKSIETIILEIDRAADNFVEEYNKNDFKGRPVSNQVKLVKMAKSIVKNVALKIKP